MVIIWKPATAAIAALLLLVLVAPALAVAEDARSRLTEQSVVRDRHGFRVGRVGRMMDGDLILRDRHGFRTGRMQSDGRGGYIIRDRHGFRTGRISPPRWLAYKRARITGSSLPK